MPEMSKDTLAALGLDAAAIEEKVVTRLLQILTANAGDEEDDVPFIRNVEHAVVKRVRAAVDDAVRVAFDRHVLPNVQEYVENTTLVATNGWGEAKQQPLTFREYIVQRAETWFTEMVDFQGKGKASGDYNWKPTQTRIAFMVHSHLQYHIDVAVKGMLATANSKLVEGLEATIKLKLSEISKSLKVEVKT